VATIECLRHFADSTRPISRCCTADPCKLEGAPPPAGDPADRRIFALPALVKYWQLDRHNRGGLPQKDETIYKRMTSTIDEVHDVLVASYITNQARACAPPR
jgi:hypothetical protein